jgi:hypothetical protein
VNEKRSPNPYRTRQRNSLDLKRPQVKKNCLIVEGDTAKLIQQGLSFAKIVEALARPIAGQVHTIMNTSTLQTMTEYFEARIKSSTCDLAVLIGHGNVQGIQFAEDLFLTYEEIATILNPFKPKTILLISCQGGKILPSVALFKGIESLEEVYGSPVNASGAGLALLAFLVPFLLAGVPISNEVRQFAGLLNFFTTGGMVLRLTREEFIRNPGSVVGMEVLCTLIDEARKAWGRSVPEQEMRRSA